MTEAWLGRNGYCLQCASDSLARAVANMEVCDFVCPRCEQTYELKSSLKVHRTRVPDGAHAAMLRRARSTTAPTLMLLQYTPEWDVVQLTAVHPVFITPLVIEERPPTWPKGRKSPWVGCTIRLDRIPDDGKVIIVRDGVSVGKREARENFLRSARLSSLSPERRGWTALVLSVVRAIGKQEFGLHEVNAYEKRFRDAYPMNRHITEKVRQQLQQLRDLGYLEFLGAGRYRVVR